MATLIAHMGQVVFSTLLLYLFVLVFLAAIGHRETSELTLPELLVITAVGSSVETAMVTGNKSLLAGLVSASTLFVANGLLSALVQRVGRIRGFVVGKPIPLVLDGRLLSSQLSRAGLTEADVAQGLRKSGYDSLKDVKLAVLEIDGMISVVPKEQGGKEHP